MPLRLQWGTVPAVVEIGTWVTGVSPLCPCPLSVGAPPRWWEGVARRGEPGLWTQRCSLVPYDCWHHSAVAWGLYTSFRCCYQILPQCGVEGARFFGHQGCFCLSYPSLSHSVEAAPWLLHHYLCYLGPRQMPKCIGGHHPLFFLCSTSTRSYNTPTSRCTNAWISQLCLWVEQRNLCWIIDACLINLRGDTKRSSHSTTMLTSSFMVFVNLSLLFS